MRALIRLFGIPALVFASTRVELVLADKPLIRLKPFSGGRKMSALETALWPYTPNFNNQACRLEGW